MFAGQGGTHRQRPMVSQKSLYSRAGPLGSPTGRGPFAQHARLGLRPSSCQRGNRPCVRGHARGIRARWSLERGPVQPSHPAPPATQFHGAGPRVPTAPMLAIAHRSAHTRAQDSALCLPDPQPESAWLVSWYVHIGRVAQIPSPSQTMRLQAYRPGSTSPLHFSCNRPASLVPLTALHGLAYSAYWFHSPLESPTIHLHKS